MSEQIYRAAIIGLGYIGGADQVSGDALGQFVKELDGTHLEALSKHPRVDLVAGSSRDEGRRQRFADRTGARTYADWHELLTNEQLDIVSVATYAPQHAEITVACAEHGVRAIYCEKPIATCLTAAERMVQACHAAGSPLRSHRDDPIRPRAVPSRLLGRRSVPAQLSRRRRSRRRSRSSRSAARTPRPRRSRRDRRVPGAPAAPATDPQADGITGHAGQGVGRTTYSATIRRQAEPLRPIVELLRFPAIAALLPVGPWLHSGAKPSS